MGSTVGHSYAEAAMLAHRIAGAEPRPGVWTWGAIGLQRAGDGEGWAVAVIQRREASNVRPDHWLEVVSIGSWEEWLSLISRPARSGPTTSG